MVEEEVAKVDGKESGWSDEKGHPQPKQLVQQQCHQGASLDISRKCSLSRKRNGGRDIYSTHPPAPVSKDGGHERDGCGSGGLGGQDGHVSHHWHLVIWIQGKPKSQVYTDPILAGWRDRIIVALFSIYPKFTHPQDGRRHPIQNIWWQDVGVGVGGF